MFKLSSGLIRLPRFPFEAKWDENANEGVVLIERHNSAKFRFHRPRGNEDIEVLICHMTKMSKCHVTIWVGFPYP